MLGVGGGYPAACGHQGAPPEVVGMAEQPPEGESVFEGRLQQPGGCCYILAVAVQPLGLGTTSDPGAQFGEYSRPLAFGLTRPPSRSCPPSALLGPSCKAKCSQTKASHSQAQLSHQPPQPSSLHCLWGRQLAQAPAYPLLRCPTAFLTLQCLLPGPLDGKVSGGAWVSDGDRGVVTACRWVI